MKKICKSRQGNDLREAMNRRPLGPIVRPWLPLALLAVLVLGWNSRVEAQDVQGSSLGQWEGALFTPKLDKVTQEGRSVLFTMLRSEETYDSNIVSSQTSEISAEYNSIEGQAQYSVQDNTDEFLLTYTAGGRFYPQYPDLNTPLQDARFQIEHLFTRRTKLTITGRWASLPEGAVETGNTNQEPSANFLEQRVDLVNGTISYEYMLSPHSSLILGGVYDAAKHFGEDFINSKEQDLYAGYALQVTRRQSIGVMYARQWLDFTGFEHSQVNNILFNYSNAISHNVSISAFAGPALVSITPGTTNSTGGPVHLPTYSDNGFVGGGKIEVDFGHNKFRADYSRLVTGGSGLAATILQQTGNLTFSHSFSRRLEAAIVGIYTSNNQLTVKNENFTTFYAEPSVHYNITPQLRFSLRGSVGQLHGLPQYGSQPRTQITGQFEYKFGQIPIGR